MAMDRVPRVVIIGAGFGGLYAAKSLSNAPVSVLLIDRHNFHTFTPLLYQVATCGLEAEEIAYPVRGIFRGQKNLTFLMGEVKAIDAQQHIVTVQTNGTTRQEFYDYLIVAGGSTTNYFNMDVLERYSFELKNLDDAVNLRNHLLRQFERAEWVEDEDKCDAMLTIVVVGGGPTGLETAGAMYELYEHVLRKEYDYLKDKQPRVILVEATDRLLIPFPEDLQKSARAQLESLGVEVVLGNPVIETGQDYVKLKDGRVIGTKTLVWAAGVKASPLGEMLGVTLQRGGRVPVRPTMEVIDLENVYVVGDMAYLEDQDGKPYPMLIPVAKQQGILAAHNIVRRLAGNEQHTFSYIDRGIMATIGRSRAVAWIYNKIPLTGYLAWLSWLGLHLIALLGFRNRINVFINWMWNYWTYDRSVRIILEPKVRETKDEHLPDGMPVPQEAVKTANTQEVRW
jgi:NADH dehydrogenase